MNSQRRRWEREKTGVSKKNDNRVQYSLEEKL
jgi:hypothetical protein